MLGVATYTFAFLARFALSCKISLHQTDFDKFRNTALKRRLEMLGVATYTFAFLARFALSCKISLHKNDFDKFRNTALKLRINQTVILFL